MLVARLGVTAALGFESRSLSKFRELATYSTFIISQHNISLQEIQRKYVYSCKLQYDYQRCVACNNLDLDELVIKG